MKREKTLQLLDYWIHSSLVLFRHHARSFVCRIKLSFDDIVDVFIEFVGILAMITHTTLNSFKHQFVARLKVERLERFQSWENERVLYSLFGPKSIIGDLWFEIATHFPPSIISGIYRLLDCIGIRTPPTLYLNPIQRGGWKKMG